MRQGRQRGQQCHKQMHKQGREARQMHKAEAKRQKANDKGKYKANGNAKDLGPTASEAGL